MTLDERKRKSRLAILVTAIVTGGMGLALVAMPAYRTLYFEPGSARVEAKFERCQYGVYRGIRRNRRYFPRTEFIDCAQAQQIQTSRNETGGTVTRRELLRIRYEMRDGRTRTIEQRARTIKYSKRKEGAVFDIVVEPGKPDTVYAAINAGSVIGILVIFSLAGMLFAWLTVRIYGWFAGSGGGSSSAGRQTARVAPTRMGGGSSRSNADNILARAGIRPRTG